MLRPLITVVCMVEGFSLRPPRRGRRHEVLLAVLDIGGGHYNDLIKKSHATYAERHGYDLFVVRHWINQTHKGVHDLVSFQKILVPGMGKSAQYDFVVVVDADVLITPFAPAIHTAAKFEERIGGVDNMQPNTGACSAMKKLLHYYADVTASEHYSSKAHAAKHYADVTASEYYSLCGFTSDFNKILNTGLLVTQPQEHKALLQHIYDKHSITQINHPRGFHFEQSAIGYELQTQDKVEWLPATWNFIASYYELWHEVGGPKYTLQNICCEGYFIHGAGGWWTQDKLQQCVGFMQSCAP
jgi:hypothetical protein